MYLCFHEWGGGNSTRCLDVLGGRPLQLAHSILIDAESRGQTGHQRHDVVHDLRGAAAPAQRELAVRARARVEPARVQLLVVVVARAAAAARAAGRGGRRGKHAADEGAEPLHPTLVAARNGQDPATYTALNLFLKDQLI